jgi:hypothetical protein
LIKLKKLIPQKIRCEVIVGNEVVWIHLFQERTASKEVSTNEDFMRGG